MAVELAVAYVSIVASARGLGAQLDKELGGPLQKAAKESGEKAGKSWGESFSQNADKMTDFGKKGLAATAVIGAGLFATAKAAGNLEAAISANIQVLGDASGEVQKWAKSSIENVGLSERAALEAATSFGQLGKIIGLGGTELAGFSTELVTAAADMAAFKDVPVAQALDDLQSGFAGSSEVLRKYGIFLDEGSLKQAYFRETGEKVTGTLTAQQRIVATNSELWRQGADMWGQAERESGGLARAQDNLKATLEDTAAAIGAQLLPAMTSVLGGVTSLISGFGSVNEATGGVLVTTLAVGTGLLGVASSVSYVGGKVSGLVTKFNDMSSGMKKATVGMGLLGLAIVAGVAIYSVLEDKKQAQIQITNNYVDALKAEAAGQKDALASQIAKDIADEKYLATMKKLGITEAELAAVITGESVPAWDELQAKLGDLEGQVDASGATAKQLGRDYGITLVEAKQFLAATNNLTGGLEEARTQLALQAEVSSRLGVETDAAGTAVESLTPKVEGLAQALTISGDRAIEYAHAQKEGAIQTELAELRADRLDKAMDGLSGALDAAENGVSDLASAFDVLNGSGQSVEETTRALYDNMDSLKAQVADNKKEMGGFATSLDITTQTGRENRDMIQQTTQGFIDHASALVADGATVEEAGKKVQFLTDDFQEQLVAMGFNREEAAAYIAQLGLTPENVTTAIELTNQENARVELEGLQGQVEELGEGAVAEITTLVDQGRLPEALQRARDLLELNGRTVSLSVFARVAGGPTAPRPTYTGGFFPGGTNQLRTVAELGGRRGDEVVLPLGDPSRMAALLSNPAVQGRVSAAMAGLGSAEPVSSGGSRGRLFGDVIVNNDTDADGFFRMANFHMAGV